MKRVLAAFAALALSCSAFAQIGYVPTQENIESRQELINSRLGIFIHWGIYSMLGDGEWVQNKQNINYKEYELLARGFYPSKFDAEEWIKAFKEAGAEYLTFTSRHHDGFSMFKTETSDFNIVDGTPFGRDVVGELAQACQKYDMRLHFYYSHLDWHREDYWPRGLRPDAKSYGRPDGDSTSWRSYENFMLKQLEELLTNYGPIGCIWFDGAWDKTTNPDWTYNHERLPVEWNIYEQYELIHSLQPSCLVGNNHHYTPFAGEDIQLFERDVPGGNESGWNTGQKIAAEYPLETCTTMNESWGYNINDHKYKSVNDVLTLLVRTAGKDANLLINIGPRPDGTIPTESLAILKGMGDWMKVYGCTIKGTRGGFADEQPWGVQTRKDNSIFVHILKETATIDLPYKNVKKITTFEGEKVKFTRTKEGVTITVPTRAADTFDQILVVTVK